MVLSLRSGLSGLSGLWSLSGLALGMLLILGACEPIASDLSASADAPGMEKEGEGSGAQLPDGSLTIAGRFPGWTRGAGSRIEARVGSSSGTSPAPIATASIDEQGGFLIKLPGAAALQGYASSQTSLIGDTSCSTTATGRVTLSPESLSVLEATFRIVRANLTTPARHLSQKTTSESQSLVYEITEVRYLFSALAGTAQGSTSCATTDGTTQRVFDVKLAPGWNLVRQDSRTVLQGGMAPDSIVSLTSAAAPADLPWKD